MTTLEKLKESIERDITVYKDSGVNILLVAALSNCLERIKTILPEEKKMLDAAREDEGKKWEAQVAKLKDDIKELVDALDWLLVVKSYRDPDDKGEYYEIEKLGAREEANRLIKKHKNEKK